MLNNLNDKKTALLPLLLGVLLLCPLSRVSASVVWEEDFEVWPFDDWYLEKYEVIDNILYPSQEPPPYITNGMLQMPYGSRDEEWDAFGAIHNSTLAYGSWSFDLYVTPGLNHTPFCAFQPVTNRVLNSSGLAVDDPYYRGYYLLLGEVTPDGTPRVEFRRILSGTDSRIYEYRLATPFNGSHHFDITRDLNGRWRIYFDNQFLYSVVDNTITTSERVAITNVLGDPAFDNITVTDDHMTVDTPPSFVSIPSHYPSSPNTSQALQITALVEDDYGVSVEVFFRTDDAAWNNTLMPHVAQGLHSVTIGPFCGSTLEYYIKVIDTFDQEITSQIKEVFLESCTPTTTTTIPTTTTPTTTENGTPGFSSLLLISTLIIVVYLFHHRRKRSR